MNPGDDLRRWGRFAAALSAIGLVWLVVLPAIGRQPRVAEHIQLQQRRGIDPSAMFYSELEIVPPIAHRIERLHSVQGMFWNQPVASAIEKTETP